MSYETNIISSNKYYSSINKDYFISTDNDKIKTKLDNEYYLDINVEYNDTIYVLNPKHPDKAVNPIKNVKVFPQDNIMDVKEKLYTFFNIDPRLLDIKVLVNNKPYNFVKIKEKNNNDYTTHDYDSEYNKDSKKILGVYIDEEFIHKDKIIINDNELFLNFLQYHRIKKIKIRDVSALLPLQLKQNSNNITIESIYNGFVSKYFGFLSLDKFITAVINNELYGYGKDEKFLEDIKEINNTEIKIFKNDISEFVLGRKKIFQRFLNFSIEDNIYSINNSSLYLLLDNIDFSKLKLIIDNNTYPNIQLNSIYYYINYYNHYYEIIKYKDIIEKPPKDKVGMHFYFNNGTKFEINDQFWKISQKKIQLDADIMKYVKEVLNVLLNYFNSKQELTNLTFYNPSIFATYKISFFLDIIIEYSDLIIQTQNYIIDVLLNLNYIKKSIDIIESKKVNKLYFWKKGIPFRIKFNPLSTKLEIQVENIDYRLKNPFIDIIVSILHTMKIRKQFKPTNVATKLKDRDPLLYKNIKNTTYTKICSKKKTPIISTDSTGIKYYNFTFDRPEYYKCPNPKYPHLNFIVGKHLNNFCIPCCSSRISSSKKEKEVMEPCLKTHTYIDIKNDKFIFYPFKFGKILDVERYGTLSKEIQSIIVLDFNIGKNTNIFYFGVPQYNEYLKNISLITSLSYILNIEYKVLMNILQNKINSGNELYEYLETIINNSIPQININDKLLISFIKIVKNIFDINIYIFFNNKVIKLETNNFNSGPYGILVGIYTNFFPIISSNKISKKYQHSTNKTFIVKQNNKNENDSYLKKLEEKNIEILKLYIDSNNDVYGVLARIDKKNNKNMCFIPIKNENYINIPSLDVKEKVYYVDNDEITISFPEFVTYFETNYTNIVALFYNELFIGFDTDFGIAHYPSTKLSDSETKLIENIKTKSLNFIPLIANKVISTNEKSNSYLIQKFNYEKYCIYFYNFLKIEFLFSIHKNNIKIENINTVSDLKKILKFKKSVKSNIENINIKNVIYPCQLKKADQCDGDYLIYEDENELNIYLEILLLEIKKNTKLPNQKYIYIPNMLKFNIEEGTILIKNIDNEILNFKD